MSDSYEGPMPVSDMTAEDWAEVEVVWRSVNEVLDKAIHYYRHDREHGTQPHPTIVTEGFSRSMMDLDEEALRALLHAAIHRLEVNRLEKEAGL